MLFKMHHLEGIKSGTYKLAFRKWERPKVQAGSLLHTAVGLIKINAIEALQENDITDLEAVLAGFANRDKLIQSLAANGNIYKISLSFYGEDPRIALREQINLSDVQFETLRQKLERLDRNSLHGYWTITVLKAISENPNLHAIGIAQLTGFEKEWLKINIRKLKNLGLTISHTVGYQLSPFGALFYKRLIANR